MYIEIYTEYTQSVYIMYIIIPSVYAAQLLGGSKGRIIAGVL